MKKISLATIALLIFSLAFVSKSIAQKDQVEKVWYNGDKTSKIEIYLAKNGTYCGKVTWLNEPIDKDTGKPKLDKENPDEKLRSQPIQSLVIMTGFKKNPDNKDEYIDGKIYDPKKGKTYCGKITFKGKSLDLRGYLCSLTFLGRNEVWDVAE
jgi:uncharacterized protein (DUF2147 family)